MYIYIYIYIFTYIFYILYIFSLQNFYLSSLLFYSHQSPSYSSLLHLVLSLSLSPHPSSIPFLLLPTPFHAITAKYFITTHQLALDKSANIHGKKGVILSLLQQKANHTCSLHASTSSFRVELSFLSCSFSSFSCRFSWSTSPNSLTVGYREGGETESNFQLAFLSLFLYKSLVSITYFLSLISLTTILP